MLRYRGGQVIVVQGDITAVDVDAVVNAANKGLGGGGGVDGAIHKAAGPELVDACRSVGPCPVGEARITPGFRLAQHVIHAVGPVWQGGQHGEDELLEAAYRAALELAHTHGVSSIAFPCISTGAYRFPHRRAAEIALATVAEFLDQHDTIERLVFCCFAPKDRMLYEHLAPEYFG